MRLSRAGRKMAIVDAIKRLNSERGLSGYTQGEICRKMGVTSQSKIRYILEEMTSEGLLFAGTTALDGYQHEIAYYNVAHHIQLPLPDVKPIRIFVRGVEVV